MKFCLPDEGSHKLTKPYPVVCRMHQMLCLKDQLQQEWILKELYVVRNLWTWSYLN